VSVLVDMPSTMNKADALSRHFKRVSWQFEGAARVNLEIAKNLTLVEEIVNVANIIGSAFRKGNKVLAMGNGGSAAQAQHLVAELVGHFIRERDPLSALALTSDSSVITALSNDFGYEDIFARQIKALSNPMDVVIGISTSGHSKNIVNGFITARQCGSRTVAFTGEKGFNNLTRVTDVVLAVPSKSVQRIQEAHLVICHIICDLVDLNLSHIKSNQE